MGMYSQQTRERKGAECMVIQPKELAVKRAVLLHSLFHNLPFSYLARVVVIFQMVQF